MMLWGQGCGSEEEEPTATVSNSGRNASEEALASALAASTEALDSDFDVSNLVICSGARVPNPNSYFDDPNLKKHNNCEWPTLAGFYAPPWQMGKFRRYFKGTFPETDDYVEEEQDIPSAVACAIKCKEHASCTRFHWFDPSYYTDDSNWCLSKNVWKLWSCQEYAGLAKNCMLHADPVCDHPNGDLLTPVPDYATSPYKIVVGRIYGGLQPGEDGTSALTECPYGTRIETR